MARILVLDDDEVSGRLAGHMLRKSGHEVHVALRGDDAWRRMSEAPADLLILDTELEGEHGWDVLERIRKDVVFRDLPVVVLSANASREVIQRYLVLGVEGILVKPCSADRLNNDIAKIVEKPWRDLLFESEDVVLMRTGLTSGGLRKLFREAQKQMLDGQEMVMRLAEAPDDAGGLARLAALRSCAVNIGFFLMLCFADEVKSAAQASDKDRVSALVSRFAVVIRILEDRIGMDRPLAPGDDSAGENGEGAESEQAAADA